MRKALILAFLLFLFISVNADRLSLEDCASIVPAKNTDSCNDIPASIPLDQQKELILSLMYDYQGFPDYAFMKTWNTEPAFESAPSGAEIKASNDTFGIGSFQVIRDAWLDTVAINPSLEASGEMFSPARGEIQNEFDYSIYKPPNEPGEHACSYLYEYSMGSPSITLKVGLNGNNLYTGAPEGHRLTEYSISDDMQFKSEMDVSVSITENVWREYQKKVSCGEDCWDYVWVCAFVETNHYTPNVHLEDTVNRKLHDYSYFVSYVMDGDSQIIVDLFSTNPLNSYNIFFNGAEFEKTKFGYSAGFSHSPYDVLHGKALAYEAVQGHNMFVEEEIDVLALHQARDMIDYLGANQQSEDFLNLVQESGAEIHHSRFKLSFNPERLQNLDKCEMEIWSHFERIELKDLCTKDVLPNTVIDLNVEAFYNRGEDITGEFTVLSGGQPFDGELILEFQNEEQKLVFFNGQGQFTVPATTGGILALSFPTDLKHGSRTINKKVFVQDETIVWGLFDLFLFFAGWIFVFILLKKSLKKWFP